MLIQHSHHPPAATVTVRQTAFRDLPLDAQRHIISCLLTTSSSPSSPSSFPSSSSSSSPTAFTRPLVHALRHLLCLCLADTSFSSALRAHFSSALSTITVRPNCPSLSGFFFPSFESPQLHALPLVCGPRLRTLDLTTVLPVHGVATLRAAGTHCKGLQTLAVDGATLATYGAESDAVGMKLLDEVASNLLSLSVRFDTNEEYVTVTEMTKRLVLSCKNTVASLNFEELQNEAIVPLVTHLALQVSTLTNLSHLSLSTRPNPKSTSSSPSNSQRRYMPDENAPTLLNVSTASSSSSKNVNVKKVTWPPSSSTSVDPFIALAQTAVANPTVRRVTFSVPAGWRLPEALAERVRLTRSSVRLSIDDQDETVTTLTLNGLSVPTSRELRLDQHVLGAPGWQSTSAFAARHASALGMGPGMRNGRAERGIRRRREDGLRSRSWRGLRDVMNIPHQQQHQQQHHLSHEGGVDEVNNSRVQHSLSSLREIEEGRSKDVIDDDEDDDVNALPRFIHISRTDVAVLSGMRGAMGIQSIVQCLQALNYPQSSSPSTTPINHVPIIRAWPETTAHIVSYTRLVVAVGNALPGKRFVVDATAAYMSELSRSPSVLRALLRRAEAVIVREEIELWVLLGMLRALNDIEKKQNRLKAVLVVKGVLTMIGDCSDFELAKRDIERLIVEIEATWPFIDLASVRAVMERDF